jgi:hypothetical protein
VPTGRSALHRAPLKPARHRPHSRYPDSVKPPVHRAATLRGFPPLRSPGPPESARFAAEPAG